MIDDFYEITTPAASDPVTLTEAKSWLRVTHSADDVLITALITAATEFGEKYCNRCFVQRTYTGAFSCFDISNCERYPFLAIRRSPLVSVSSVSATVDGSSEAVTDYSIKDNGGFARLLFPESLPAIDTDIAYPLSVSFIAGYGVAANVPEDIKTAIKAHISFLYENRGDAVAESDLSMPLETKSIYSGKYRIINTF